MIRSKYRQVSIKCQDIQFVYEIEFHETICVNNYSSGGPSLRSMLLCSSRHIPKNFKRKMAVKLWLRLFPVRSYYFWRISPLITPWELITRRFMTIEIIRSPRGAIYLVIGGGNLWISEFSVTVQGESYLSTSV